MLVRYLTLGFTVIGIMLASCVPIGASVRVRHERQLVEIMPGIYVYEDDPQEVFYVSGFYWRRHGSTWHRSSYYDRDYHEIDVNIVPSQVRVLPQGRYVHYRRDKDQRDDGRDDRYRDKGKGKDKDKDEDEDDHGGRGRPPGHL